MMYTGIYRMTVLVLPLLFFWPHYAAAADPATVAAITATRDSTLSGYTRARTVLDLAAETTGKIETVFVDIGGDIPENRRFACMDRTFIDLDIEANEADIARTRIDIDYFDKQVERHRKLVRRQSSSQLQLDDLERSLATARQQLRSHQVRAKELSERRRRHCMKAPAGWTVMERYIEPGEWVKSGDPVARIGNFSRLLIPVAVSLNEFEVLQQNVENLLVSVPELNLNIPARIERVSPAFDEQSRKIVLDLAIDNDREALRAGIRVEVHLRLPGRTNTILLPEAAVTRRYEQYWIQPENGKKIAVVYLGPGEHEGKPMMRLSAPGVRPGDRFLISGSSTAAGN